MRINLDTGGTNMRMNDDVRKWLDALRSGKYPQTRRTMKRVKGDGTLIGYCCLGVAAEEFGVQFVPTDEVTLNFDAAVDEHFYGVVANGYRSEGYLPQQLADRLGLSRNDMDVLTSANDGGFDFNQIADAVEYCAERGLDLADRPLFSADLWGSEQ